jgi:pilus assembly protein Flp/PilA
MRPEYLRLLLCLRRLITLDHGQDLVEYALVVALIAFAATASMKALATGISTAFDTLSVELHNNAI